MVARSSNSFRNYWRQRCNFKVIHAIYFWTKPSVSEVPEVLLDALLHITPKNSTPSAVNCKPKSNPNQKFNLKQLSWACCWQSLRWWEGTAASIRHAVSTAANGGQGAAQAKTSPGPAHFMEGIYKKGFKVFYLCFYQLRYFTPTLFIFCWGILGFFFCFFFAQWEHNVN